MRKYVFVLIVFVMIFGALRFAMGNTKNYTEYYEIHKISYGDTLWSIAQSYSDGHIQTVEYVEKIKDFNNMKSDALKAGQQIIVPVYVCEK